MDSMGLYANQPHCYHEIFTKNWRSRASLKLHDKSLSKNTVGRVVFLGKMVDFSRDPTVIPDISAFYQQK